MILFILGFSVTWWILGKFEDKGNESFDY